MKTNCPDTWVGVRTEQIYRLPYKFLKDKKVQFKMIMQHHSNNVFVVMKRETCSELLCICLDSRSGTSMGGEMDL
jgi:hypothetical protein